MGCEPSCIKKTIEVFKKIIIVTDSIAGVLAIVNLIFSILILVRQYDKDMIIYCIHFPLFLIYYWFCWFKHYKERHWILIILKIVYTFLQLSFQDCKSIRDRTTLSSVFFGFGVAEYAVCICSVFYIESLYFCFKTCCCCSREPEEDLSDFKFINQPPLLQPNYIPNKAEIIYSNTTSTFDKPNNFVQTDNAINNCNEGTAAPAFYPN